MIIAGDSDYIPLAQCARRLGRAVIGVGVDGSTSAAFKNACDDFTFYHELELPEPEAPEPVETTTAVARTLGTPAASTADPKREGRRLLVRALRARNDDNVDGWVAASALKQQMKRLDAGFDEKKLGYKSFTDFVKANGSLAEIQEDGLARRVRARDRGKE